VFTDGGGRQLGYVALSRARQRSTLHAIADDHDQALDDLRTDWTDDRRQRWLTHATRPGSDPRPLPDDPTARARRLRAELDELERLAPPDTTAAYHRARADAARLRADRDALAQGRGRLADTPAGRAAARYHGLRRHRLDRVGLSLSRSCTTVTLTVTGSGNFPTFGK
jgi:hypothetical protein